MFNNDGTITAEGGSAGRFLMDVPTDTAGGTVDVQSGTLELEAGGTSTGSMFTVESGATLDFAGTWTLDANSTVDGAGTVTFAGTDTITVNGGYDITGATVLAGSGTVDVDGPIESIGAALTVEGGTLTLSGPFSASAGTIPSVAINDLVGAQSGVGATVNFGANDLSATTLTTKDGAVLNKTGTITVSGMLTLDGGTLSGAGDVDANAGIIIGDPQDYYVSYRARRTHPRRCLGPNVDLRTRDRLRRRCRTQQLWHVRLCVL